MQKVVQLLRITAFLMSLALQGHSQDSSTRKVTLNLQDVSIGEALLSVQKQTGITFVFSADIKKYASQKVTMAEKDIEVSKAIRMVLKNTNLQYTQMDDQIVIDERPAQKPRNVSTIPNGQGPGILKGRVVDFETDEPLPGATLQVNNSSGITTDGKGFYAFRNLPAGKFTLSASYVGYDKAIFKDISVEPGKVLVEDIKLKASSSLKAVSIDGSKTRIHAVSSSTDRDLLREIRGSIGVVSGISNEQIVRTADRNAAEVVKRISGVSVVDERFIVVRGMNERYNLAYLNSNQAPTTELYNKAFAFDLLPSSIIDRILVYKSPQADLLADFAGGVVKVYTKNARPVRHLDIGVQLAQRPGSTLTNINSYNGGKYDFLGFDDGTRKLPAFSPSYFQSNPNWKSMDQSSLLKGFTPVLGYGTVKSIPDMQLYLNYYDNWKLGKSRLYDLTSVNYTHETRNYSIYNQTGNTYIYLLNAGDQNLNANNRIINGQQATEVGKINALENLTLRLNGNNQLEFKNFFVNEGRKFTTVNNSRPNTDPSLYGADYMNTGSINLSFQQRLLYSGNLGGEHDFQSKKQHLSWNLGYSYTLQSVPDQRNSAFSNDEHIPGAGFIAAGSNQGTYEAGFLGMINRLFIRLNENAYNLSADYTLHISQPFTARIGTYQLYKTREVGRRFFRVNRGGLETDETNIPANEDVTKGWIENYGQSNPNLLFFHPNDLDRVWSPNYFPNDGSGLALYDVTSPVDSYVASEQNNAGYLMGDWNPLGKKLTVNAGLRVEYDKQKIAGATGSDGAILPVKVNDPKTSWLPSVNINYRPDTAYSIRLGYGRTVNRPDFRELAPYNDFDFQNNQTILGNPDLTSATIDNYDLRFEFYPESAGQNEVFTAGIFYKALQNPIEQLRVSKSAYNDLSSFTNLTFGNAISAKVYGVEAEIKKNLSFIPLKFFRQLSVIANGALIKSTTRQRDYVSGNYADSNSNIKGRPLQGQSPYVLNAGLSYENPALGTKVSIVYNVSGPRIYAKSSANPNSKIQTGTADSINFKATRPDLLQLPQKLLDFSITQRLIKSLQIKFSIQNLLNQSFTIVEDQNYNQKYDREKPVKNTDGSGIAAGKTYYTGDNIFQRYNPGRYFIMQLTYAF